MPQHTYEMKCDSNKFNLNLIIGEFRMDGVSFEIGSARIGHFRNAICTNETKRKKNTTNENRIHSLPIFLDRNVLRMIGVRVASLNVWTSKKKADHKRPNTKWPSRLITKCRNRNTWSKQERYPLVCSVVCSGYLAGLLFKHIEIAPFALFLSLSLFRKVIMMTGALVEHTNFQLKNR